MIRISVKAVSLISFFVTSITFSTITPAAAACKRWYVGGSWNAVQSNGFSAQIELHQTGNELRGTGRYASGGSGGVFGGLKIGHKGSIDGAITGNSIMFTIYWDGSSVGVYKGTIGTTGRIDGNTYDKRNPQSRAAWYSSARMKCGYLGSDELNAGARRIS